MIELRILRRRAKLMDEFGVVVDMMNLDDVLQYREAYESRGVAEWGKWKDVPIVTEE